MSVQQIKETCMRIDNAASDLLNAVNEASSICPMHVTKDCYRRISDLRKRLRREMSKLASNERTL